MTAAWLAATAIYWQTYSKLLILYSTDCRWPAAAACNQHLVPGTTFKWKVSLTCEVHHREAAALHLVLSGEANVCHKLGHHSEVFRIISHCQRQI